MCRCAPQACTGGNSASSLPAATCCCGQDACSHSQLEPVRDCSSLSQRACSKEFRLWTAGSSQYAGLSRQDRLNTSEPPHVAGIILESVPTFALVRDSQWHDFKLRLSRLLSSEKGRRHAKISAVGDIQDSDCKTEAAPASILVHSTPSQQIILQIRKWVLFHQGVASSLRCKPCPCRERVSEPVPHPPGIRSSVKLSLELSLVRSTLPRFERWQLSWRYDN